VAEQDSRQDDGRLGAHIAGQWAKGVQRLYEFPDWLWNRGERTCGGPHPGGHSLAEEQDETEAAAGGMTQYIVSQLLVTNYPILAGGGLGQRGVHRGFF
jgi:hypothetical protein